MGSSDWEAVMAQVDALAALLAEQMEEDGTPRSGSFLYDLLRAPEGPDTERAFVVYVMDQLQCDLAEALDLVRRFDEVLQMAADVAEAAS